MKSGRLKWFGACEECGREIQTKFDSENPKDLAFDGKMISRLILRKGRRCGLD
jgi:hypothetical protein